VFARHRRRDASDDGFTLVELVVAIGVLAIGIVSLVGVSNSSFSVAGSASRRSKAVSIATEEVESWRAVPYAALAPSAATTTKAVNNVTYTVETAIDSMPDGNVTNAYKRGVVAVSWADHAGTHEVHQSTLLYPGNIGPAVTVPVVTTTTAPCIPTAPTSVVAESQWDGQQEGNWSDVTWVYNGQLCPATSYVLQYSNDGFATSNEITRSATASTYHFTGLSASSTYSFRVAARSVSGSQSTWSPIASLNTGLATAPACVLGSVTITPAAVQKKAASAGSGLSADPVLSLPTYGSCPGFTVSYAPTASSTRTAALAPGANGTYAVTLLGKTIAWDVGKRFVDVYQNGSSTRVASVLLTVCEHNVSTCA
jgi:prepilin-type N-terminal cleavage/methylation domain-containing protein